jgi:hypothetical protein
MLKSLTPKQVKLIVGVKIMPGTISEFIKNFFFPEQSDYNYSRRDTPMELLAVAYERISKLATQIEAHAAGAPYPHIRRTLHDIAVEKFESAKNIRALIEKPGEKPQVPAEPKTGINHWERLNLDLQDQIALDDFLFTLELKAGETPGIGKILRELRTSQRPHRQILADLIAIADPQANQT